MNPIFDINVIADALQRFQYSLLAKEENILDIGSGSCSFHEQYSFKNVNITFTDMKESEEGIFQEAKKRLENVKEFRFVETPAEDLSMFKNDEFDMLVFSHVIEHMTTEQQDKALAEMSRVLKKDKKLIIATPNREGRKIMGKYKAHSNHIEEFSPDELAAILNKHGFEITNDNSGLIKIISKDEEILIDPIAHSDTDDAYFIYFICVNKKGEK